MKAVTLSPGEFGVVIQPNGVIRTFGERDNQLHHAVIGAAVRCMGDPDFRAKCLSDFGLLVTPAAGLA